MTLGSPFMRNSCSCVLRSTPYRTILNFCNAERVVAAVQIVRNRVSGRVRTALARCGAARLGGARERLVHDAADSARTAAALRAASEASIDLSSRARTLLRFAGG